VVVRTRVTTLTALQVFMPLLEEQGSHWLLLCADCQLRRFVVYDSYASGRDKSRDAVISNAVRILYSYVFTHTTVPRVNTM